MKLLTEQEEHLLTEERSLLNDLRAALIQYGAATDDQATLAQSIRQLDDLFLIVIVGEFNSGKSSFINALLGQKLLKEGVTPTTTQINILKHGPATERIVENEHIHVLTAPVEMLRDLSIVDTPGTNAVIREHEAITSDFVPRADLVMFITSVDRPFTESERQFLELIRDWGKKVLIVLNKVDLVQSDLDLDEIQRFVANNAYALFGLVPEIFPVSSRQALRAKVGEQELWEPSRFEALETYIRETLDQKSRLRLKFLNPLGVGSNLVNKFLTITLERLDLLKEDFTRLEDVEAQLKLYEEDMRRDFDFRMSDIENVLYEMERRGEAYFDETIRISHLFDLLNRERIQQDFEQKVVLDVPQQIDRKVTEMIDWLVDADFRQWQSIMEHLSERRRTHQERIVGDPGVGTFHSERERLIQALGRQTQRVVETYDRVQEAEAIADGAQTAVAALAAVEVSALSLGTIVTIMATTVAADVTGILLASVVAALGLLVIPARRAQAKSELRTKLAALREELVTALSSQFSREIERSIARIRDAMGPYSRFVRAEQDKLSNTQSELERISVGLAGLKVLVDEIEE